MKCCIVSSKLIVKHDRWDVGYYLGDNEIEDRIKRAEKSVREAAARLKVAKRDLAKEKRRVARMITSGLVKPVK